MDERIKSTNIEELFLFTNGEEILQPEKSAKLSNETLKKQAVHFPSVN